MRIEEICLQSPSILLLFFCKYNGEKRNLMSSCTVLCDKRLHTGTSGMQKARHYPFISPSMYAYILHTQWSPMMSNGPFSTLIWSYNMDENDIDHHCNAPSFISLSHLGLEKPIMSGSFFHLHRKIYDRFSRSLHMEHRQGICRDMVLVTTQWP